MERGDEAGSTDPCLEERPEADPGFLNVSLKARFKETGDPFVGAAPESEEVLIRNADTEEDVGEEEEEEADAVGDGWPLLLLGASSRLPRRDRA